MSMKICPVTGRVCGYTGCGWELDVCAVYPQSIASDSTSPLPSNEDELDLWIEVAQEFHFDRNKHRTMVQSIISRLHNKFSITRK